MKNRNKTLKSILVLVLTFALAITGVSFSDLVTAQAATETLVNCADNSNIENTTVTMKPGDVISIRYLFGYVNVTKDYEWTCSDNSVVTMNIQYFKTSAGNPAIDWIELYANKPGTVTITGTHINNSSRTHSFTIVVKEAAKTAKVTAKQKKCKHVWKTTRKATCMRNGMKVCKKCKLEKVIKQKAHKFVTKEETREVYETYAIYVCNACTCGEHVPTGFGQFVENPTVYCDALCGESFDAMDYDTNNNGFDINDVKAAYEAFEKHKDDNNHICPSLSQIVGYCNPKPVTKTVTRCKSCGMTPEQIKNAGQ